MSYDRQIDQLCPHAVLQEALFVNGDGITVSPIRRIASAASVALKLNGEINTPSTGVQTYAQVTGQRQGPFNIRAGVNDVISIRLTDGIVQTVALPASNGLNTELVAGFLNRAMTGVTFSLKGSRLSVRTLGSGKGATMFLLGTSTFLDYTGIPINREYSGKNIVPGWSLINDPNAFVGRPARLIVFDEPLRGLSEFVEINYTTERSECRRCGAVGVENDWRYGQNAEVVQVTDEALLEQEVSKMFYTKKNSNQFHTWYGTDILEAIGRKITADGFLQNFIVSDIQQAFARWQSIKRIQEEAVGQEVTDKEYPFALQSVELNQSTTDPTVIFVSATIQNRSSDPIVLDRGLRFPLPLSLVDPNAAQGVIRQSLTDFVLVQ